MTIDAIRKRYAANADADNPTYYCTLSSADVDALFRELAAERGKVKRAIKCIDVLRDHFDACDDCEEVLNMRADLNNLAEILKGGGDD